MVDYYISSEANLPATSVAPLSIGWLSRSGWLAGCPLLLSLTVTWVSEWKCSLENTHTDIRFYILNLQSIFTCLLIYFTPFHRLGSESLARLLSYNNIITMPEFAATSHLQKSTYYFWFQEHSLWQKINYCMVESEWNLAKFNLSLNHQFLNLLNEANIYFQGCDKD